MLRGGGGRGRRGMGCMEHNYRIHTYYTEDDISTKTWITPPQKKKFYFLLCQYLLFNLIFSLLLLFPHIFPLSTFPIFFTPNWSVHGIPSIRNSAGILTYVLQNFRRKWHEIPRNSKEYNERSLTKFRWMPGYSMNALSNFRVSWEWFMYIDSTFI